MAWDVDSLKEYVDSRIADQDKAVLTANMANDKRLDSVNEFRNQLNDQTRTFLTRNEFSAQHESLQKQITALTNRINLMAGRSTGISTSWSVIAAAIGAGAAIVTMIYFISHLH